MPNSPLVIPAHIQALADRFLTDAQARFGADRWRMEADPASPPSPAPEPTPATPPAGPAPEAQPTPAPAPTAEKVEDLPEWAQRTIKDLRKESGDRRAQATTAEQERQQMLDGIAKALGLKPEESPPDPAALQQTLTEREARVSGLEQSLAERDREIAAWRSASRLGANATALLDSRSFLASVASLDVTASDFNAKLDEAVKGALAANPALRANPIPTPGQAGIGVTGSSGASTADSSARDLLRNAYQTQ